MALKNSKNQKYQLLEVSLVSAYDLDPPSSIANDDLRISAVLYIDPKQKLRSLAAETAEPKWDNEKFVFIVDSETLNSITTAHLVVQLYGSCGDEDDHDRDTLLGTSRVLLGMLGNCGRHDAEQTTGTFREYHVRRTPDGDAQGVLNLGFTVLEGLPISDDQLVATGLAVDCKKLPRSCGYPAASGQKKGVAALMKRWFGRFNLRK